MADRLLKGNSGRTRTLFFGEVTTPRATEYSILLDTTRLQPGPQTTSTIPKSATLPTVGTYRGVALGKIFPFLVSCTGQSVTVLQYGLAPDGTWDLVASTTIVAGADAQSITWDPSFYGYTDVLVTTLAGAIAPTKVYATVLERTVP